MQAGQNLQIDGQRLWDSLMHTAQIGGTAKGGICRLTLTDLDRQVRDWFKAQCEALGCTVTVDDVGNMFARREGKHPALPPIAMGSHLDTQPTGGKFDGVLGVLGALEAMRTLHHAGYETNAPIEIVNWTNEEGSRFAPPMLASGVFAGVFTPDYAYSRMDRDGKRFGEELERIGYKGGEKAGAHNFAAMFELHIEQGPILEDEGCMIGVVQGVQGMRWYEVTVTGQEAHTGATPMRLRKNALLGAARMIERIDAIAREHARRRRHRRPDREQAEQPQRRSRRSFLHRGFPPSRRKSARRHGGETARRPRGDLPPLNLSYTEARIWNSPAVKFAPELIECVRIGAQKAGFKSRDMISGAGHDAVYVARVAPTTMIFVPCAGGISHNEAESTSFDECAAGAQVLLNAVLEFDRRLG